MSSYNPVHSNSANSIFLIAVIRFSDKVVVASSLFSRSSISIEGVRECVAGNTANIQPGKRFTSSGDFQAIHYQLDAQGKVYAIVTSPNFSTRIAFCALDDVVSKFKSEIGNKVVSASEGSLNKMAHSIFKEIYDRYNTPNSLIILFSIVIQ
jgi:hypothetical protein